MLIFSIALIISTEWMPRLLGLGLILIFLGVMYHNKGSSEMAAIFFCGMAWTISTIWFSIEVMSGDPDYVLIGVAPILISTFATAKYFKNHWSIYISLFLTLVAAIIIVMLSFEISLPEKAVLWAGRALIFALIVYLCGCAIIHKGTSVQMTSLVFASLVVIGHFLLFKFLTFELMELEELDFKPEEMWSPIVSLGILLISITESQGWTKMTRNLPV